MKASDLIYELKHLIEEHGDKQVCVNGYDVTLVDYDIVEEYINIEG